MRVSLRSALVPALFVALGACGGEADSGGRSDASATVDGGALTDGSPRDAATGGDGGAGGHDLAGGSCAAGSPMAECQTNADCDDGNPATTDTCVVTSGGEFPTGTCIHSACDGGSCASQAVDPTCGTDAGVVFPPAVALHPPDVPAACANGFELADATPNAGVKYVVHAKTAAGSRAITADLDFATYTAPDGLQVTGVDGNCKRYILFDSCRLRTATQPEGAYTNGMMRPAAVAIRQYHIDIRPGTTQLTFDFSRVVSPMYVEVLGLCDFDLPQPPSGIARWFALVP